MKLNIRIFLKKIPIIRRLYSSLAVRFLKLLNINNFLISFMDVKFSLTLDEPIDKSIILFNQYENKQISYAINLISKYQVSIFFDIGAHCGIYSLIIGKTFNSVKIHSFEPIKSSFIKLKKKGAELFHLDSEDTAELSNLSPKELKDFLDWSEDKI